MDYIKLGRLAIENHDYQEAINIFRAAWDVKKDAPSYMGFAIASYKIGDLPAARWAFYQALKFEPDLAQAHQYIKKIEEQGAQSSSAPSDSASIFRVGRDYLEVKEDGRWSRFFIKGMNLGLGLPGSSPGEFAIRKGTYLKWFKQMIDGGLNAIRTYTLHPPAFYEALYEVNRESESKLYLMQGIWLTIPEGYDFNNKAYLKTAKKNIRDAIDVIYGSATLPVRAGYAHGEYRYNVSPLLSSFILGREWEGCSVRFFNDKYSGSGGAFNGASLKIANATPFELWITRMCDFLQTTELKKYKLSHPLSVVAWPTLDPMSHDSESVYEDELKAQGLKVRKSECNESEDMASLDTSKIKSKKGAGFYATYHVYPYYPDFMNNDYLDEERPYLAYLKELKAHHKSQPVYIAEFGVPASREVTHWQRLGWNHGGHNERAQGEIDALMINDIYDAGMAGGALFSWFDEWFKRNWVFVPYELPAFRNKNWFNLQDAEQNYGLIAAYPGYPDKTVYLAGRPEDWQGARVLYAGASGRAQKSFDDGADGARALKSLSVKHDEGFIYLKLETVAPIDFKKARYLIGIDTSTPEVGERLLPFLDGQESPVGLKFLIELTSKEKSRILVSRSYDKFLNVDTGIIRPTLSHEGAWVSIHNKSNARRLSKDFSQTYPARVFPMGSLVYGTLDPAREDYDSLADFFVSGNAVELRIPWGLINVTDPSSHRVLWKDGAQETRKTDGIGFVAFSYKPVRNGPLAVKGPGESGLTDSLPKKLVKDRVKRYSWDAWNIPTYHSFVKKSYYIYRDALNKLSVPT